jgi:phospholipase/carboxylesterase
MSVDLEYARRPASRAVRRAPGQSGDAAGALVLLHGRGTDERDLLPLLDEIDPGGRLVGITLRAPLQLMPGGYHWYIVRQIGHPDEPTFTETFGKVSAWLDGLPAITGVGLDRTVLGGFSQGAVMAYALALGQDRPPLRALIALSGFIPEVSGFALDLEGHLDLPVAIGHGTLDPVISVAFGRSAADRLQAVGLDVLYRETRMGHTIDPSFTRSLASWLEQLPSQRRAA